MTVIPFAIPIIEEIFNESNQIFGASKINAILRNRGYVVPIKLWQPLCMKTDGSVSVVALRQSMK